MDGTPGTRRTRARQVGMLMQGYRRTHGGEGRGGRLSQEGLLRLMGEVDERYLDTYDRSTVSKWETGEILPTRERLEVFGRALNLSRDDVEGMLFLGGLEQEDRSMARNAVKAAEGATSRASARPVPAETASAVGSAVPSYAGEMTWFVLSRFLLPGLAIAGAGYFLASVGWSADWMLTVYIGVVIAVVLSHYFLRLRRYNGLRDLLFVSIFVVLSTTLLQSPLTRMDIYGFYAIDGLANTPMPFILALLVNLFLALSASVLFDYLYKWQYSQQGGNPYRKAAWVSLPPLALVYVCGLLFTGVAIWLYLMEVFTVLGGVFIAMLVLRDESVGLSGNAKWLLIYASVAITILLTGAGLAGMMLIYVDPNPLFMPGHNPILSWDVDYESLGYFPSEMVERGRLGIIWSSLAAIIYMVAVIGGSLLYTICRKDTTDSINTASVTAPLPTVSASRKQRSNRSRVDARYRPGWLAGHRILQPVRSGSGYPPR